MKKKRLHYLDLGRLPVTPVEQARVTTRESIIEEEAREIALKNIARIESPEQRRNAFLFWSASLNAIAQGRNTDVGAFDDLNLERMTDAELEGMDPQKAKVALSTFNEFLLRLGRREGIILSRNGQLRLGSFAQAQVLNGTKITVEALQVMYDRLQNLDCFDEDEVTFDPEIIVKDEVTPQPAPPKGIADIEKMDTETTEGRRRAIALVNDLASSEAAPLFAEWLTSLRNHFGFVPTNAQCQRVVKWFQDTRRSFLDRRNYDAARKQQVAIGEWPESLLTEQDLLDRSLEQMNTAQMSFSDRQGLNRTLTRLSGPRGAGMQ